MPAGASIGEHEAIECRDGDKHRYFGKGVQQAVRHVQTSIATALIHKRVDEQLVLDRLLCALDGTPHKQVLGANTLLAVSLACAKAAAKAYQQPFFRYIYHQYSHKPTENFLLPAPMMNILNGGAHADNAIDIQEFMIMPVTGHSFSEALQVGVKIFHYLKHILKKNGHTINVGDEGGLAPALSSNDEAMTYVLQAIQEAGYCVGKDVLICIDAASSEYYQAKNSTYRIAQQMLSQDEMIEFWVNWTKKYPIFSIEDPMAEDDWEGWQKLTQKIGNTVQLVGDDLFVTHPKRLNKGVKQGVSNAILIKLNQIGTLSETLEVMREATTHYYKCIVSHRSGETEDHSIADLAVGTYAGQIKTGAPSRSERLAKYNQLLRIEEILGDNARFAGKEILKHFQMQQHVQEKNISVSSKVE